ncbi:DUF1302 domain-containing protein [Thalassotalea sp. LPB0316]|uniref:DUF1302 domain-containing protein n=1 Tax=Thalassotalea sp. LPB0316 TaxID=2769490 RepID=UPI0018667EB4|nr:DUF1302 domain-containing protein [Thalassotalea sp. LPB0316]QOL26340.1 DUF1302 domain-containing protein [Thalassotalea sp. LPB0316]
MSILRNNKSALGLAIGAALFASNANSAEFYFGENDDILLTINSQLSIGASWRIEDQDPRYISANNGGTGATMTTDDGNLNFDKGDTFSKIIKGSHELQLSKDNYGAFVRFKYWHDKELQYESRPFGHSPNGYEPGAPLNDDGFQNYSKFSGIALLDAYVYGTFELGESLLDVRVGRQVLSWGESTFIQGGMNSTNPFDVSALRRPGADLKEGILPVGMVYGNLGLTENLSIEAFYQYEWEKFAIDACGTLFQGADFAADGCNYIQVGDTPEKIAFDLGIHAERRPDIEPDDGGQYGLAMRYFSPELNDTEFGLYYMNIHSRVPLINAVRTAVPLATGDSSLIFVPKGLDPTGGQLAALNPAYAIAFPEDLKFYGASFATNVAGLALSGEVSYKPDTPVQINGPEILNAALSENPAFRFTDRMTSVGYGEMVQGWDEYDVTQIQVTALQFFERVMGAARLTVIGEAGVILTDGIEDSDQRYGRNAVFGLGDFDAGFTHPVAGFQVNCSNLLAAGAIAGDCSNDGYVTDSAWGYRLRAIWDYPDVYAGISLKPTLAWSHDVSGYSPEPAQQFNEGKKVLGLSLEASYLQKYSATVGYSQFSGGSHNILTDKDFVSLSFAVSY